MKGLCALCNKITEINEKTGLCIVCEFKDLFTPTEKKFIKIMNKLDAEKETIIHIRGNFVDIESVGTLCVTTALLRTPLKWYNENRFPSGTLTELPDWAVANLSTKASRLGFAFSELSRIIAIPFEDELHAGSHILTGLLLFLEEVATFRGKKEVADALAQFRLAEDFNDIDDSNVQLITNFLKIEILAQMADQQYHCKAKNVQCTDEVYFTCSLRETARCLYNPQGVYRQITSSSALKECFQ